MTTLIKTMFGSNLYGTNTPTSDTDYKSVHVPSANEILLLNAKEVINNSTGSKEFKNTKDDIDDESFSILKYFNMLKKGDMVAQELLHIPENYAELYSETWKNLIIDNKHHFIDKNIKGFVGYIHRQCAVYGIKGTRVEAVRKFVEVLNNWGFNSGLNTKIKDIPYFRDTFNSFVTKYDNAKFVMMPKANDNEQLEEYFELVDRKISYNISVNDALKIFQKVLDNYGARALAAETNQGVDWKSLYHAVRVSQQAIELLETGNITFPRQNKEWLLQVKRGDFHYNYVAEILENNLSSLLKLMETSDLPSKVNEDLMDDIVLELHLEQVKQRYFLRSW